MRGWPVLLACGAVAALCSCRETTEPAAVPPPPDPCTITNPLTLEVQAAGAISREDCRFGDGSYFDVWTLTLDQPRRVDIVMNSGDVDAYLALEDTVQSLAYDNDGAGGAGTDAAIRVLLPARRYFVIANTLLESQLGAYALLASGREVDVGGCETVWVVRPFTSNQTLPAAPCPGATSDSAALIADQLPVYVTGGELTVEMSAPSFAARVRIVASGTVLAEAAAAGPGQQARASLVVPFGSRGKVVLQFSAADSGNAGAPYVMSVR